MGRVTLGDDRARTPLQLASDWAHVCRLGCPAWPAPALPCWPPSWRHQFALSQASAVQRMLAARPASSEADGSPCCLQGHAHQTKHNTAGGRRDSGHTDTDTECAGTEPFIFACSFSTPRPLSMVIRDENSNEALLPTDNVALVWAKHWYWATEGSSIQVKRAPMHPALACWQYHEISSSPFLASCFCSAASMAAKRAPSSREPLFLALFAARKAACASALLSSRSSSSFSLPAIEAAITSCGPDVSRELTLCGLRLTTASKECLKTPALELA